MAVDALREDNIVRIRQVVEAEYEYISVVDTPQNKHMDQRFSLISSLERNADPHLPLREVISHLPVVTSHLLFAHPVMLRPYPASASD